jgi:hypothetical protein
MKVSYKGMLDDYFETGCEGTYWVLFDDTPDEAGVVRSGYDRMHFIEAGDEFTVFNPDGTERFTCLIEPDTQLGWKSYPLNPTYGQPLALGRWIHWTQSGWSPDDWARLFIPLIPKAEHNRLLLERLTEKGRSDLFEYFAVSDQTHFSEPPGADIYWAAYQQVTDSFRLRGRITRTLSS